MVVAIASLSIMTLLIKQNEITRLGRVSWGLPNRLCHYGGGVITAGFYWVLHMVTLLLRRYSNEWISWAWWKFYLV